MKAAVYEGIEKVVVKQVPVPDISDKEVLIEVKACAICGTDIRTFHYGWDKISPPVISGHELAGTIVKVGKEVKGFAEGENATVATSIPCLNCPPCSRGYYNICDNLTGIGAQYSGGFAEYLRVPEALMRANNLIKIPAGLSFEEACLSEPFACAVNGQELARIENGDTVVVIGTGPLGCMHAELAPFNGAKKIIMADILPERLALVKKDINADRFIDLSKENLKDVVLEMTAGRGAEVVIVAAPSGKAQESALQVVAPRGRLNLFGGLPKTNPTAVFNSNIIHYKEIFVHGAFGSTARQQKKALELFAAGKVNAKKFVSAKFPLERILDGYAETEKKRGYRVLITME